MSGESHQSSSNRVQLTIPSIGGPNPASIILSITRRIPTYCACTCSCHENKQFQTPNFLGSLLGSVLLSYTGTSNIIPPCNQPTCRVRHHKFHLKVHYWCPKWPLSWMIAVLFTYSRRDGLMWQIRMPRVRHNSSLIFNIVTRRY